MSEGETEAETETMVETMPETMAEAEHQDHAAQGPHGHRRYRELRELIAGAADLDQDTRQRALDIFDRLAAAEGRLHGVAPAEVSFHELGAIDSVVDIVGTAAALSYLAPSAVSARPVPLGTGSLRCAHGLLPVPSPAALELLRDAEVEGGDAATEITTPTGAAILAATATSYGPMPRMRVEAIGYGAGDMELPGRPNLLRLVAGLPALAPAAGQVESEPTLLVEANLDDMSPELAAPLLDRLLAVGAVDAWFVPAYMKKNRPGFVIAALAPEPAGERVCGVLLRESTTLGIRLREVERRLLGRTQVEVETAFGKVLVKLGLDQTDGGRVVNVAPELESCRRVAESCKVPLKQVYAAALVAYATDRPTGDGQ
jgi:uncharacterized protein (TIGR00299 family) protein